MRTVGEVMRKEMVGGGGGGGDRRRADKVREWMGEVGEMGTEGEVMS